MKKCGKRRENMLIVTIHGGLVSQIRAFYIAYRMSSEKNDKLILDLSQYYNGYYQPYLLDYLDVPNIEKIMLRGSFEDRLRIMEDCYQKEPILIEDGESLEDIYGSYDNEKLYYIVNDCCEYDLFCMIHREFFFRYIGKDDVTSALTQMMQLRSVRSECAQLMHRINEGESIGVHIRLRDFVKVGWMVEKDYAFYKAAIQWYRHRISHARFFIFSDDISKARKLLGENSDMEYVKLCGGYLSDVEEFLCLSQCKHKVLTKKSGYSLYAAALARNNGNEAGYTVIIEHMNLSDNAANPTYIERNFNQNLGCHKNEDLSNCVELSEKEIAILSRQYEMQEQCMDDDFEQRLWKKQCDIEMNYVVRKECERLYRGKYNLYSIEKGKLTFLFVTLQSYSQACITEMERMAYWLALEGHEVHFVGTKVICEDSEMKCLDWTIDNREIAKDNNGHSLGYYLYPYNELREKKSYPAFVKKMSEDLDDKMIVIVRKPEALPMKEMRDRYACQFVFVDFMDLCVTENFLQYSEEEITYLYENVDLVITFSMAQYQKWSKKIGGRICYIDSSCLYPFNLKILEKIESPLEISCKEEAVYKEILEVIIREVG